MERREHPGERRALEHEGHASDILTYVVGIDVGVSERFSLAIDVLGQHVFDALLLSTQTFTSIDPSHQTFADIGFHTGISTPWQDRAPG